RGLDRQSVISSSLPKRHRTFVSNERKAGASERVSSGHELRPIAVGISGAQNVPASMLKQDW
ncbi:MAG: hypothetical protein AAFN63_16645, partial [Pseudomonadota bacterium]